MIPELGDEHGLISDLGDDAMLVVDPPGPVAGQGVLERLRLALALVGSPRDPFDSHFSAGRPAEKVFFR